MLKTKLLVVALGALFALPALAESHERVHTIIWLIQATTDRRSQT